ncbi:hypothetical protein TURU_048993 [Turdus rufiventris]|nr:hypothetical protein TURU_048993 [Turdus rufiventris]
MAVEEEGLRVFQSVRIKIEEDSYDLIPEWLKSRECGNFFELLEEIDDSNNSKSLEKNLIMSRTKVNPAAAFSYESGTPVRAELPITAELQRGSPLVLRLDSERQTASIPLAAAEGLAFGVMVKGEAKNLPTYPGPNKMRDCYCTVNLDQEEVFRTKIVEKSLCPFYGEDFYCEIPRTFRHLSFYIFDRDVFRRDSIIGFTPLSYHYMPLEASSKMRISLEPCLLQAEQPVFMGEVLWPSDQLSDLLDSFHILLVLGPQTWMKYTGWGLTRAKLGGQNHLPRPAGHTAFAAALEYT